MLIRSKAISLIIFSILAFSQQTFCEEEIFFEKVAKTWMEGQKNPDPIVKQIYEKTKNSFFKSIKKSKEAALNILIIATGVTIGVCAGIYIYEKLIKKHNDAQNKDKEKLKAPESAIITP